jgi:predicted transcriptional regulator
MAFLQERWIVPMQTFETQNASKAFSAAISDMYEYKRDCKLAELKNEVKAECDRVEAGRTQRGT